MKNVLTEMESSLTQMGAVEQNGAFEQINWSLVQGVARSLYLSLRLLPTSVRTQIATAYLLARASDTITDTASVGQEKKERLAALLQLQKIASDPMAKCDAKIYLDLARLQTRPSERRLLEHLPTLVEKLQYQTDTQEIREVWSSIVEGQILDVERQCSKPLTPPQLDRYIFLVAGCVGKFWTRICHKRISKFASLSAENMERLGILYGNGLQLINIIRDRDKDASLGRAYLCAQDVKARSKEALMAMQSGVEYVVAVNDPFLRYATLLPALFGVRTLGVLRSSRKVKISRREVRYILTMALPTLWRAQSATSLLQHLTLDQQ